VRLKERFSHPSFYGTWPESAKEKPDAGWTSSEIHTCWGDSQSALLDVESWLPKVVLIAGGKPVPGNRRRLQAQLSIKLNRLVAERKGESS